jgi:hypothetical protein
MNDQMTPGADNGQMPDDQTDNAQPTMPEESTSDQPVADMPIDPSASEEETTEGEADNADGEMAA